MIYIIEGVDGTGKSTMANLIADATRTNIMHMEQPVDSAPGVMFSSYMDIITNHKDLILDRAWYSEMIYGPVFRKHSQIPISDMFKLEKELIGNAVIIYCRTSNIQKTWLNCKERGEDFVPAENYAGLFESYEKLMLHTKHLIPVLSYEIPDI